MSTMTETDLERRVATLETAMATIIAAFVKYSQAISGGDNARESVLCSMA